MAQAPQKPDPKRSESTKAPDDSEVKVPMAGTAPKPNMSHQSAETLPDATKAEQAAGQEAQQLYADRLKAEQEAGASLVKQNEGKLGENSNSVE